MRIRVGARTDVGIVREHNEDAYLAAEPIFAVADGMGGHQAGEVASRVALETIDELRRTEAEGFDLGEAVRRANVAIIDLASDDADLAGMGTTLTLIRTEGSRVRVAHVGDSRVYLLRDGELHRLTEDHTLVHRMMREGKLTETEAERHPHRSILTRALGADPDVEVDLEVHDVSAGDRVLLCSDGLTSMVTETAIREILLEEADPQTACDALVRAANAAGGQDNITTVVLDLEPGADPDHGAGAVGPRAVADRPTDEAPAPEPERPRRWRRILAWLLVAAAVLAAVLVGVRVYLDSQWFVGVSDGRVALFRGIPTEVLGYDLFSVVAETDLPADEAARVAAAWQDLPDGITASSEEEGRDIIRQIQQDLESPPP